MFMLPDAMQLAASVAAVAPRFQHCQDRAEVGQDMAVVVEAPLVVAVAAHQQVAAVVAVEYQTFY